MLFDVSSVVVPGCSPDLCLISGFSQEVTGKPDVFSLKNAFFGEIF